MTQYTFRTIDIPTIARHAIGFEKVFDELGKTFANIKTETNYPPYNIVSQTDDHYIIEIAVAGFSKEEIDIERNDNTIIVRGEKQKLTDVEGADPLYVHKGISDRNWSRVFPLAKHVEVKGADLKDGILSIFLERIIPEEKRPKKITIGSSVPAIQE